MLLNDLADIFRVYTGVECSFRIDDHDGAEFAHAVASGGYHKNFFFKVLFPEFLLESFQDLRRAPGGTTGSVAYQYVSTI